MGDRYVILPQFEWEENALDKYRHHPNVSDGFVYRSDANEQWVTADTMKQMVQQLQSYEA